MFYQDFTGFGSGSGMGMGGSNGGSPFGFGGGNGCQTDTDTGLVLMGHRYYDTRIGRFISQDPAGDGDNWYAYAGNSPTNAVDPSGLSDGLPGSLGSPDSHYGLFEGGPDDMSIGAPDDSWIEKGLELDTYQKTRTGTWVWTPDPTADNPDHGSFGLVWGPWSPDVLMSRTPLGGEGFATTINPLTEMRMPKPLVRAILGGVLGALSGLLPGSHGAGQKAPEPLPTPPAVTQKEGKKKPSGSNFLRQFENLMQNSGRNTEDNLDYWADVLSHQKSHSSQFTFGGAGGALAWD